jgi:hypothetical protein
MIFCICQTNRKFYHLPGRLPIALICILHEKSKAQGNMQAINPATMYIVFSQRVSARSKASKRRFSHSKASFENAVCGQTRVGLTY